jgi:nucleotide-binding universal stress UspA family protein
MAHVSRRLKNSFDGALAGGGDPASSPLYVFGPFLRFLVIAGVARVTFGASVWLVVLTVAVVSFMYRQVIQWVTDGTGGSGLTEEEFGAWAVKINSGITFVEYTLTFLVSIAALVTLAADRLPGLDIRVHGFNLRTVFAIVLSFLIGWLVNRGPRVAAQTFGPATLAVLLLLWTMIVATIWRFGLHLPDFSLRAFDSKHLRFTLSGFSRLLALMTGIEVFANLVAAYEGSPKQRSRKAFRSLLIAMGTTCATMLVVGPAILDLADPLNSRVSVFTQAMDRILPSPLPYLGTLAGIVVLASAAAASAQGLQNLALGLRYRHYVPARVGQRNRSDVADVPVWIEVSIVCSCFAVFGTDADVYLSLYAVGVFVLLSMTGWAAAKRTFKLRHSSSVTGNILSLSGAVTAAVLTSAATIIIFFERFSQGAWAYFLFIPLLYVGFSRFRRTLGEPISLTEQLGRLYTGQYLLPLERKGSPQRDQSIEDILVPLDGSQAAESALSIASACACLFAAKLTLLHVESAGGPLSFNSQIGSRHSAIAYVRELASKLQTSNLATDYAVERGHPGIVVPDFARDLGAELIVMSSQGLSILEKLFVSDVAEQILRRTRVPVMLIRPNGGQMALPPRFKKILVPLDGSLHAEGALRFARKFGTAFGSDILVLGVPEADFEMAQLTDYVQKVGEALRRRGLSAQATVAGPGPAQTIADTVRAGEFDLIVLAKNGRGGSHRHTELGSVALHVIHTVSSPILLVSSEDGLRESAPILTARHSS